MKIKTFLDYRFLRGGSRRLLAWVLCVGLIGAPLMDPAYGAATPIPLADVPIAAKVQAKPNIIYTMDDSGSMQFGYLPDWVVAGTGTTAITKITRVGVVATAQVASTGALYNNELLIISGANQPEYDGQWPITILDGTHFTYTIVGAPVTPATGAIVYATTTAFCRSGSSITACSVGALSTFNSPPYYAADFNRLAYNPNVNYQPAIDCRSGLGCLPLTHTIGVDTDVNGNEINFAKVQSDPFTSPATQVNLTVAVAVPLYCNTDWPVTAGVNLAITDVGNANGEYSAGTGAYCRINGTKYDASATSGAPAVVDNYNYPYQSSSGATGAQYFYKLLGNKILYCDLSSPYFPHSGTITSCGAGTPILGAPAHQTCNRNGFQCNTTPAARNYTPAACKTGPFLDYCAPNTGGSDGYSLGTGATPECTACTCNADFQPAGGRCSSTGAFCTGPYGVAGGDLAQCPDIAATITGCTCPGGGNSCITYQKYGSANCTGSPQGVMWDPVANAPTATTLLSDSNGAGVVCRHNTQAYAVTGAPAAGGLFTYPRTNLGDVAPANKTGIAPYTQTGAFTSAATAGCPTIGTAINIPRHYYTIDSVQFCNNIDPIANDQWRGFGTGACQAANDLTNFRNVQYGQFHRIDLVNDGRTFAYTDQLTGAASSRTYAQEIINYANWYAYYRLRSMAGKTTTSLALSLLDNTYRVGFETLGTEPFPTYGNVNPPHPNNSGAFAEWVDVADFTNAQKKAVWTSMFGVLTVTNYKTPSLDAMLRIGNLVETGGAAGLPLSVQPLPATAKDPFPLDANNHVISCTNNYHIEFTDGATDQVALPVVAGDQDQLIPAGLPPFVPGDPDKVHPDLTPGNPWPAPFQQGTAVPNTLADIATYYWARDLRPGLKDDVPAWSGKTPNDIDPTRDIAWWQHVQFSAISFGAAGTLDATNQPATLAAIVAGTQQWPDLTNPNNPPKPLGNPGAVAVDDLWHATVNSRGRFVYARSPLEVQYGLAAILAGIQNQRKSRAGAAFSGQVLSVTNHTIYEATIEPGWSGDILQVLIDPTTGAELSTPWRASTAVANQIKPSGVLGDEPWMDETKRRIVSWNGGTKVAFRATPAGSMGAVLSAAQLSTLSPIATTQQKMVAYLRGGSTVNKPIGPVDGFVIEGTGIGQYRERFGPLGDISNAQPLVVSAPQNPPIFYTGPDPGYAAFVTTWNPTPLLPGTGRPDRIIAAANDGMVHVIDSADGHEVFGYVPSELLRNAVDASGKPTGLVALTFQDGGVPIYKHHFYVDSSPRTQDVDLNSAGVKGGASDWHTIVVGGMGKGGASYYALDLTDPNATNEAAAAAKLMWEYHDPDWTYTYGHPVIAKTYAFGWTVIVTSGYNNVSGEGRVYFLNPKTGLPYAAKPFLSTGPVSCTAPDGTTESSGLAQINGFTKDFHNQFTEQVYGGDLCGNFWRFDVHDPNPANWRVDKFATLVDTSGNPQPVTTAPQIEIDFANGVDRYVFIGTGRLLDTTDLSVPSPAQQQTMYAFRDGSLNNPLPPASLPVSTARGATLLKPVDAITGSGIVGGAPNGWYHDLPIGAAAERIVVDVEADVNVVSYIGTQVTNDPCTIALPANIYGREYASGRSLVFDGAGNPFVFSQSGGVGMQIVGLEVRDASGNVIGVQLGGLASHEIPGTGPVPFLNPTASTRNRFSWRLLQGQ